MPHPITDPWTYLVETDVQGGGRVVQQVVHLGGRAVNAKHQMQLHAGPYLLVVYFAKGGAADVRSVVSPNVVVERPRATANEALRGLAATQPTLTGRCDDTVRVCTHNARIKGHARDDRALHIGVQIN